VLAEPCREGRRQLRFVAAVGRAERFVLDEPNTGIAPRERAPDERKDLLALEEVIPQLAIVLPARSGLREASAVGAAADGASGQTTS